jgi:hypothetical protein
MDGACAVVGNKVVRPLIKISAVNNQTIVPSLIIHPAALNIEVETGWIVQINIFVYEYVWNGID